MKKKVRRFKIVYKCNDNEKGWHEREKIVEADSFPDAVKKADMWPPLIRSIEEL